MRRKERATAGGDKFIYKLDRLITKFELTLDIESAAETSTIHTLQLSERDIYFILEALKIFREDLITAAA